MRSLEIDELLARLYVDPRMRSEFLADRLSFARRYGYEDEFVSAIDPEALKFFAESLVRKRANEVRKLIPLTASALADDFEAAFDRFADGSIPSGYNRHAADALAFCRHVTAERSRSFAAEVATFDLSRLGLKLRSVTEAGNPLVIRALKRKLPVIRLARFSGTLRALLEGKPAGVPGRRTLILFLSIPGLTGIWYW
ncbi:MAG TPA: hypothetical protein VFV34_26265 [Blastocatellia bacterium]|nr:hypothetical protein [Blastocatellia bacterium]